MKVIELIDLLSKQDPEMEVEVIRNGHNVCHEIEKIATINDMTLIYFV